MKTGITTNHANDNNENGTSWFYSQKGQQKQQQQQPLLVKGRTEPSAPTITRKPTSTVHRTKTTMFQMRQCPVKDKICNKCTKRGHYARLCKSSNVNAIQDNQTSDQIAQDTDVAAYVNYMQAGNLIPGCELVHPDDSTTNTVRFERKTVGQIDETDLKGHLVRVRCGSNDLLFIADTGLPTSFINQRTANLIISTVNSARRVQTNENNEANRMVCYNGYKIQSFGRVVAPIESGGWNLDTTSLIPQIGIQLLQKPAGKSINAISEDTNCSDPKTTNWVKSTYPGLCTRIGRARNHMVHTTFLNEFKALQQKDRRIPIHIQKKRGTGN